MKIEKEKENVVEEIGDEEWKIKRRRTRKSGKDMKKVQTKKNGEEENERENNRYEERKE